MLLYHSSPPSHTANISLFFLSFLIFIMYIYFMYVIYTVYVHTYVEST